MAEENGTPPPEAPKHPLDGRWFVFADGKSHGPYSGHEIASLAQNKRVTEDTLAAPEGSQTWVRAGSDPVLSMALNAAKPVQEPPAVTQSQKIAFGAVLFGCAVTYGVFYFFPSSPWWLLTFIGLSAAGGAYQQWLQDTANGKIIDRGDWPNKSIRVSLLFCAKSHMEEVND